VAECGRRGWGGVGGGWGVVVRVVVRGGGQGQVGLRWAQHTCIGLETKHKTIANKKVHTLWFSNQVSANILNASTWKA
jgi:hypothetical protein